MPEFRRIIETPPVTLRADDIKALARMLTADLPARPKVNDFSFSVGDMQYRADSFEELMEQHPPSIIDGLTFTARGWTDDNNIDRGITFNLRRTIGDYQIHALDEIWFKGKVQQINEFLNAKRPWYASIRSGLPALLGALQGITLAALLFLLYKGSIAWTVLAGLTLALLIWAFKAFLDGKLLPKTKLVLADEPSKIDRDLLMLVFTALGAIGTAAGVIIQILSK